MKKALQYLKNYKTKLDTKLREKNINTVIECEECCVLVFKYIGKSLDGLRYDFDKH